MKTLVIHCHPSPDSFVAAVRDAALVGLRARGHEVRVTDLYTDGFDPVFSANARYTADLQWCESLVLVYPTWWAGQPAMLKGWIDRVWVRDARLRNVRRITVVTTHGSSKFVNALEGEAGKRTATRALRVLCSRTCRTRWIAMYNIDRSTLAQRHAFLQRVTRRFTR